MDELLSRQVPHSLEAEQSVLGSMLIDSRCVSDVIGMVRPEEFYLQQNRDIFETIYAMFNFSQPIDPVTVLDKMKERGVFDEKTTLEYFKQLMDITPTAANVAQYCAIVHDKALLRSIDQAAAEIQESVQAGTGPAASILENAEKKIYALSHGNTGPDPGAYRDDSPESLRPADGSLPSPATRSPACPAAFGTWTRRSTGSINPT